jgi:hypothetical protein
MAEAKTIPQVRNFMMQEISRISKALNEQNALAAEGADATCCPMETELSLFRLRVRASTGFDIEVARLTLEPAIELFFR